jgi:hypothetical protein
VTGGECGVFLFVLLCYVSVVWGFFILHQSPVPFSDALDAAASIEVCGVLHSLAQSGLTIVAVIHQPRYNE